MAQQVGQSGKRTASDWALFALLSLMWAGAYQLTRIAVDKGNPEAGLPAAWVLAGRLTIGAAVLWVIMLAMGRRLPPLTDFGRWRIILLMGLTSSTFPFFLITTAQKTVNSSLAALYTAVGSIEVVADHNTGVEVNAHVAVFPLGTCAGAVQFDQFAISGVGCEKNLAIIQDWICSIYRCTGLKRL